MPNPNQTTEPQIKKQHRHRSEPTTQPTSPALSPLDDYLLYGPQGLFGQGAVENQIALMRDPRMSGGEWQMMAEQVGQVQGNLHLGRIISATPQNQIQRYQLGSQELQEMRQRYDERIQTYQQYYANPKYVNQEAYFGRAIINVITEIKARLTEFEDPRWMDRVSDFLQKRWFLGVQGAPAFEAKYGTEALEEMQDTTSSEMWAEALHAAKVAESNPDSYDSNREQRSGAAHLPQDVRTAFEELKGVILTGDPVFDDDKEYATYLQTIAHDYIDLSDAMIECGCGSENDWALLIDILTDESAEGDWVTNFVAWAGDVLGMADEALEDFISLTMKRATRLSMERDKGTLICPDID